MLQLTNGSPLNRYTFFNYESKEKIITEVKLGGFGYIAICFSLAIIYSYNHNEESLSSHQKENIKKEVIGAYKEHVEDLMNLDYEEVMKFYPREHIIYVDGEYRGDYSTFDEIWRKFTNNVQEMIKWDLDNHQVFVHNRDAASYLVEFVNWRIESNGDTTKVHGSFSFGMHRYPAGWKAATQNVTHHYTAGPWVKECD